MFRSRSFPKPSAGDALGRRSDRQANLRASVATILNEIDEEIAHVLEVGDIDDGAALPHAVHEACILQDVQLCRQGARSDFQSARNLPGREAWFASLYQKPEHGQPVGLSES